MVRPQPGVLEGANGDSVWASIPKGPVKDGIINLCNLELARREITTGSDEAVDQDQDAPLVRGYNFLRSSPPDPWSRTDAAQNG